MGTSLTMAPWHERNLSALHWKLWARVVRARSHEWKAAASVGQPERMLPHYARWTAQNLAATVAGLHEVYIKDVELLGPFQGWYQVVATFQAAMMPWWLPCPENVGHRYRHLSEVEHVLAERIRLLIPKEGNDGEDS